MIFKSLVFIKFIFLCCICEALTEDNSSTKASWNPTWTDLIKRDLLNNYDKYVRPTSHLNTTKLSIKLSVTHIDVVERKEMMIVDGWLKMEWTDDKLKWNPEDYGNMAMIHLGEHEVWHPDLSLYNAIGGHVDNIFGKTNCLLFSSGLVLWVPPAQFRVLCEFNLRTWPYDRQTCLVKLGSWTYSELQINLNISHDGGFELKYIVPNGEWSISEMGVARHATIYECCEEPYVDIEYTVTVQRKTPLQEAIVIGSGLLIIAMILCCFWLPPQSGEKILLNSIAAVITCIFLIYIAIELKITPQNTPLIVLFYRNSLFLIGLSIIISIIVLSLSRCNKSKPVPNSLKSTLNSCFGRIILLPQQQRPRKVSAAGDQELQHTQKLEENTAPDGNHISEEKSKDEEWNLVAMLIDRIAFLVYSIVFIILVATYCSEI